MIGRWIADRYAAWRARRLLAAMVRRDNKALPPSLRWRAWRWYQRGLALALLGVTIWAAVDTFVAPSIPFLDGPSISAASLASATDDLTGSASVIDGDTIEIRGTRVRLWGIDAPESRQQCRRDGRPWLCGGAAANALSGWIGGRTVRCADKGGDQYGRMIGRCFVGDADVSAWMVENGWAMAFTRYSRDYTGQERRAKAAKAGIWASEFEAPWEWRESQRGR